MSVGLMAALVALTAGLACLVLAMLQPRQHRDRASARADMQHMRTFLAIGIVLTIGGGVGLAVDILRTTHTDEVRVTFPAVELPLPDDWRLASNDRDGVIITRDGGYTIAAVTVMAKHAFTLSDIASDLERFTSNVPGLREVTFYGPRSETEVAKTPAVLAHAHAGQFELGVWAVQRSSYRLTLIVGLVPRGHDVAELQYVVNGVKLL